jgi:hypothetical protein
VWKAGASKQQAAVEALPDRFFFVPYFPHSLTMQMKAI